MRSPGGSFKALFISFIIVVIGTNLLTYFMYGYRYADPLSPEQEVDEPALTMDLLEEVLQVIDDRYIEPVDLKELSYGAVEGMLAVEDRTDLDALVRGAIRGALETLDDPRTIFYDPEELENFLIQTTGSFGGIGVRIVEVDDDVVVFETIPDTPAERAGIFPGDRIRSADGEDLTGQGVNRAAELLRGPKGTTVAVSLDRPGADEPIHIVLERDDIQTVTVFSEMLEPGIAYIEISSFDSHTGAAFVKHLQALEAEGITSGLILDLRNNTGGLVQQAVNVAKMLLPEGEITRLVKRGGEVREIHYSSIAGKPYPLVVLVNEETASAAEIVAGALQDHDAAVLVGAKTFGKATVQQIRQLTGDSALLITEAKYLTPSGMDIHGHGITPDYLVEMPQALKYYRVFLPGSLQMGDQGENVRLLQEILRELGYNVSTDGIFGDNTATALAEFQEDAGLEASGLFDDRTWAKIRETLEEITSDRDPQLKRAVEIVKHQGSSLLKIPRHFEKYIASNLELIMTGSPAAVHFFKSGSFS